MKLLPWADGRDPSPDCYSVTAIEGGFAVCHFRTGGVKEPCCRLSVRITDADRQDPEGADIAALTRAARIIEQQHRKAVA